MTGAIRALACAAIALIVAPVPAPAGAQAYPTRPIRLIVPFPPSGSTDIVARTVAERLGTNLGVNIVVENRAGATGAIGLEALARSAPDGYTIGLGTIGSVAINPLVSRNLAWDPRRDFTPVGMLGSTPFALIVTNTLPARSFQEFVALARSKPGALDYATGGIGGSQHLAAALLEDMAGISIHHVPYKGSGPAITDLIGGQVAAMIEPAVSAAPHVKAGRVRMLAQTGAASSPAFPDVPTVAETVPGYDVSAWFALFAPAGVPSDVLAKLSSELQRALRSPELVERFAQAGVDVAASTPDQLRAHLRTELDKWARVVRKLNLGAQ